MRDYLARYTRYRMDAQEMELDVLRAKVDRMGRENVDGERAKFEAYDDVLTEREHDLGCDTAEEAERYFEEEE